MSVSITPGASPKVVLSGTTNQVVIEKQQNQTVVNKTTNSVEVQRQAAQTLEVSARGPQGPSFAGAIFLDTDAIASLTSADEGKILVWNGSTYIPQDHLDTHLTIVGGAF
jgi:hypothetical protein